MRTYLLGLTATALMCACGADNFASATVDGGDDGAVGDGSPGDAGTDAVACLPQEICGNGVDDNCNQQIDEGCNGLGTFVSGATGNDANPGTTLSPVKTIAKGIANALTLGGARTVYVAGSHYPEKVTLVEGVSLAGGYLCNASPCPWTLDAVANDTAILNPDFEGVLAGPSGLAYVANWFSGDVSVVDLAQRREIFRIKVGEGPRSFALLPDSLARP